MNNWNNICAFLAVAETGSLCDAAERLHLSQPTLGRYITALEDKIGQALFIRSRLGMELTQTGLQLVDDAKAMQQQADHFALKAAGRETSLQGAVRITASDIVATHILPSILVDLKAKHPGIDLELVASDKVENLLTRDADIAIRMVRPVQSDLISVKVNDLTMSAWASKTYLESFGRPTDFTDLRHHQIIGYDRNDTIIKEMKNLNLEATRELFTFRTDDQVVYWELVKAGAGIGFGSNYIAAHSPELEQVLPDLNIPSLPMWLTSHQDLKTNRRIRVVMDFLKDTLKHLQL